MTPHLRSPRGVVAPLAWAVALAALVLLGGCRPEVSPGGEGRRVVALFDDALNLPDGAPVKAGGVPIGRVERIAAQDYRARVTMRLEPGEALRRGSTFRLRYTTALGELYVDVTPAAQGERLPDGAVVDAPLTSTAPTVEDGLAQASLLVNGGNLRQVATIVDELNVALGGRVDAAKGVLHGSDRFLVEVLRSTRQIDRALVALDGAARTLADRRTTIRRTLRDFRPAARVLRRNTDDLVRLLNSTDRLAVTADGLVRRTRDDVLVVLRELGPVLDEVYAHRREVLHTLDVLNRFAGRIDHATPTDYLNLYFKLRVDTLLRDPSLPVVGGQADELPDGLPGGLPGAGTLPGGNQPPGVDLPPLLGGRR